LGGIGRCCQIDIEAPSSDAGRVAGAKLDGLDHNVVGSTGGALQRRCGRQANRITPSRKDSLKNGISATMHKEKTHIGFAKMLGAVQRFCRRLEHI
jgi:hypothetical protein